MIHPYDPQAAMNAKYAAFARKNAATARRLGPNPDRPPTTTSTTGYAATWRDDRLTWSEARAHASQVLHRAEAERAEIAAREDTMDDPAAHAIEEAQQRIAAKLAARAPRVGEIQRIPADPFRSELVSIAAGLLHVCGEDPGEDEKLRLAAIRLGELADGAAARASQAATATNGARDDAGAAHGGDGAAAGRTALRDRIRDAFHTIAPDCVAYHPADCTDCTTRADAVMAEMQAELDAKDAEIARLREQIAYYNRRWHQAMDDGDDKFLWVLQERSRAVSAERRSDRYRTAWESARRGRRSWRQRAEAAEAALATQNAENDRLDQLLIDERAITARLNRELGRLRDQNGHHT